MPLDWALLLTWAVVLLTLVGLGIAAGRLAARFFLRATSGRGQ